MPKVTVTEKRAEAVAHLIEIRRERALYPPRPLLDTIVDTRPARAGWENHLVA